MGKGRPESPIGTVRLSRYGYRIKIGLGTRGWKSLSVYAWEEAFGPVPKGYLIHYKDGDTTNCALENLELMSYVEKGRSLHKSDKAIAVSMSRKKGGYGLHDKELALQLQKQPVLLELKRLQMQLNTTINEHEKK